jgi:hypothetical protein
MKKSDDKKPVATLVIRGLPDMPKDNRKRIAIWLRELASSVVKEGDEYSKRFIARYHAK